MEAPQGVLVSECTVEMPDDRFSAEAALDFVFASHVLLEGVGLQFPEILLHIVLSVTLWGEPNSYQVAL